MECKRCGADNPPAKRTCMECGAILEGYTFNNVTGEFGYRGGDGEWYKSEEEYLLSSHKKLWEPSKPYQMGDTVNYNGHTYKHTDKVRMVRMKRDSFKSWLWLIGKVLMILAFLAAIVFLRIKFDAWYVNWLMK